MIYLFHGEDEFTRSEELAKLKTRLGGNAMVSLNVTTLKGRGLTLGSLVEACSALPFMSERRMVIVEDFWSSLEPRRRGKPPGGTDHTASQNALLQGLMDYLPRMPETTRLLFIESAPLGQTNPAHDMLPPEGDKVIVRQFRTPQRDALDRWVVERMRSKGGTIAPRAAHELTVRAGDNLRQLDQELEKLLAHTNYQGTVSLHEVRALVATTQPPRVFALVDAMGMRQEGAALRHLHELLDSGAAPLYLLSMVERQFRILLQVKDLAAKGVPLSRMQKTLGISHRFIVEKSLRQVARFSLNRLKAIHERLAEVEYSIKSGRISEVLALDLLVVETCS
jgi:DNA polymerase-3 subunit delta